MTMRTLAALLLASLVFAEDAPKHPGLFEWEKDLDTAVAKSEKDGRPVILYFTYDT